MITYTEEEVSDLISQVLLDAPYLLINIVDIDDGLLELDTDELNKWKQKHLKK